MKKIIYIFLTFALIFFASCKKQSTPICQIISPQEGQEFYQDEDIPIQVIAEVSNGLISSVLVYIDDIYYKGTYNFPYNFTIKAGDVFSGVITIKAVAVNTEGRKGETSVKINVKEREIELAIK